MVNGISGAGGQITKGQGGKRRKAVEPFKATIPSKIQS